VRRRNTPDSETRGRILAAALGAAIASLTLIIADATRTACAQPSPGAAPSAAVGRAAAKPSASAAKKRSASSPASDTKAGAQNNPFGMMKFSADNGPIQIKAESLNLDYKNNTVEFKGTVHATQSGTTLTSNALKVIYGQKFGDIKQVVALGDVKMMQGGRWATGQRAVLDEVKHTVEMTGAPVIHDGPDSVAGRRIIIYLDTEKSVVEGASAVIFPRDNNAKPDHETAD
jgi:lipopolysaccharide export system protein LptA